MRFCCGVSPSVHACPRGSIAAFALGSRLSFFLCQEKRDGLRCLTFLFRRVEIAIRAFSRRSLVICLCGFTSGLCVSLWRSRRGYRGAEDGDTGLRGWRRGDCALLRKHIGLVMLSAGSTLGLNVEAALRPPQTAPKSRMWERHCRLSGLSSRCGGVALVRIRSACASLRSRIGFAAFSAGSTLGLRAPDCAKESSTLWTLFTLRRGCVGANTQRLCVFAQSHWPCCAFRGEYAGAARPRLRQRVKSGSRTAASLDSLHGAGGAAFVRFCVTASALQFFPRGVRWGLRAPKPAPKSRMWKRHCRLSGLSSRCGGAGLVRIRRAFPRCAVSDAVLARRLPRLTPAVCRMATNRTACDILRFYSAGSRSPFARSRNVGAVICLGGFTLGLCVSLWRSRRGNRGAGNGERGYGVGGAAFVRFCAAALAL